MPIRPENKALYPGNWKEIRRAMLERAGNQCEWYGIAGASEPVPADEAAEWERCDAYHHAHGYWDSEVFVSLSPIEVKQRAYSPYKLVRIVLTIAHMDHDPTNNDPANLKALCQRHHNRYDASHRKETRAATLANKTKVRVESG